MGVNVSIISVVRRVQPHERRARKPIVPADPLLSDPKPPRAKKPKKAKAKQPAKEQGRKPGWLARMFTVGSID
jgi:hypothetical protein